MQSTFTYMNKINLQNNGETEAQGGSSDLLTALQSLEVKVRT